MQTQAQTKPKTKHRIRSLAKKLARLAQINFVEAKQIVKMLVNYTTYDLAQKFPQYAKHETFCTCCGPELQIQIKDFFLGQSFGGVGMIENIEKEYQNQRPEILKRRAENRRIAQAHRDRKRAVREAAEATACTQAAIDKINHRIKAEAMESLMQTTATIPELREQVQAGEESFAECFCKRFCEVR